MAKSCRWASCVRKRRFSEALKDSRSLAFRSSASKRLKASQAETKAWRWVSVTVRCDCIVCWSFTKCFRFASRYGSSARVSLGRDWALNQFFQPFSSMAVPPGQFCWISRAHSRLRVNCQSSASLAFCRADRKKGWKAGLPMKKSTRVSARKYPLPRLPNRISHSSYCVASMNNLNFCSSMSCTKSKNGHTRSCCRVFCRRRGDACGRRTNRPCFPGAREAWHRIQRHEPHAPFHGPTWERFHRVHPDSSSRQWALEIGAIAGCCRWAFAAP